MPEYYSNLHEIHYRRFRLSDDSLPAMGFTTATGFMYDVVTTSGSGSTRVQVNFTDRTQTNLTTNKVRLIRRVAPCYI